MRASPLLIIPALALVGLACSEEGTPSPDAGTPDTGATIQRDAGPDAGTPDSGDEIPDAGFVDSGAETPDAGFADSGVEPVNPDCDPLQPDVCALPWPSNLYLEEDALRETGYTLAFGETSLPANLAGQHVSPEPYRRLDGYGVGTAILVRFPRLDPTGLADENNIGASMASDAPILLFEYAGKGSLERVPYIAEVDQREADLAKRVLFVRPARILEEGRRYVVAFRNLVDMDGAAYAPSDAFAALVAGSTAGNPRLAPRQARFDRVFLELDRAGVPKDSLQLAWDFNTASGDALHGAMLTIRDDALAKIDANTPVPTITSVTEYAREPDRSGRPVDPNLGLRIEGELVVPSYLDTKTLGAFTSTVLSRGPDGTPQQNGTRTIPFWMNVPHRALTGTVAMDLTIYGHGLLGSGEQALSSYNRPVAQDNNLIFVGANLTGFDELFLESVGLSLRSMTLFEWVAESTHQGLAEYLMLGRVMMTQAATIPELVNRGVQINPNTLYYSGISQGGIFGATYLALSQDIVHGHLGVPGNNYSILLQRSVDFDPFFEMLATQYRDATEQALLLTIVEQIWEMTDPVSYLRHISLEPFPNTPAHRVLLAPAKGDYQVSVLTNEILARSGFEIPIMDNYDSERTVYGVTYASYPRQGSGIVLWDHGNPWPAPGNITPMDGLGDPHGLPRRNPDHSRQLGHFLRTGEIIDVCGGDGCDAPR